MVKILPKMVYYHFLDKSYNLEELNLAGCKINSDN